MLVQLFEGAGQRILRQQILGLLKNVVQRNWTVRRRVAGQCYLSESQKEAIRERVLQLYKLHWRDYYQQFNMIFEEIAKQDFPTNYPALYSFIVAVLNTLSSYSLEQILVSEELLPYLSTVKKVLKNYGKRRILHSR